MDDVTIIIWDDDKLHSEPKQQTLLSSYLYMWRIWQVYASDTISLKEQYEEKKTKFYFGSYNYITELKKRKSF